MDLQILSMSTPLLPKRVNLSRGRGRRADAAARPPSSLALSVGRSLFRHCYLGANTDRFRCGDSSNSPPPEGDRGVDGAGDMVTFRGAFSLLRDPESSPPMEGKRVEAAAADVCVCDVAAC